MKPVHRKLLFLSALVVAVLVAAIFRQVRSTAEPTYGGKRLSVWLDELSVLDYSKAADPNTRQAAAVRAIGTNALPWLLSDLKGGRSWWEWRLNAMLETWK